MEELIGILVVGVIAVLIVYGICWLIVKAIIVFGPFLLLLMGLIILVGFCRGSFLGIKGYYQTLIDVYGKKIGLSIGISLTVIWALVFVLFGWSAVRSLSMLLS